MARNKTRRTWRLEVLEKREVLSAGGPSADAQYMLELVNLARTDPAAAATRVTSNLDGVVSNTLVHYGIDPNQVVRDISNTPAKPPLAWSDSLANAATGQSQYQVDYGIQTHQGPGEADLGQRMDNAGYTNRASAGENAYAYSTSVDEAMQAFLIDWGVQDHGHFKNILEPTAAPENAYREVGIGIVDSNRANFGPKVITQDFGAQQGEKAQLLGVAYDDPSHFYAPGDGRGDVTIDVVNKANGQSASVQTWDAGGYQIPLDPGTYTVTARVGDRVFKTQDVTIGTTNVKVDFDLSDPWQPAPAASASSAPVSAPVVTAPEVTAPVVTAPAPTVVIPTIIPSDSTPTLHWDKSWNVVWGK